MSEMNSAVWKAIHVHFSEYTEVTSGVFLYFGCSLDSE